MADMNTQTITAFFDNRTSAQKASEDLSAIGVLPAQIRITEGSNNSAGAAAQPADKSFWDELKDLFMPEEDRYGYAEGLRRGGYLLSAEVDSALYDRALSVLDTDGAVNMDEREASWKSSGWTGYQAGGVTQSSSTVTGAETSAAALSSSKPTSASSSQLAASSDEVIPVYEETAKIGKRDVNHGRVRLRSYVVETPIIEQVNLRNERVQVERRAVDRVVSAGDAVFQDRTIEAEEHVEEAVVAKETRVKEEIGLRKSVENQAKTVTETLRRTKVEVLDDRAGNGAASGFMASKDAGRIVEHMDVIASDGAKIGIVDHLDSERIKLAKSASPDGQHHFIPLAWVDHVDTHVHLNKPNAEAMAGW